MAWITDENHNLVEIPSKRKNIKKQKKEIVLNKVGNFLIKLGNKLKGK